MTQVRHVGRCPLTGIPADAKNGQCHGCDGCDTIETVLTGTRGLDPTAALINYAFEEADDDGASFKDWLSRHGQDYAPPTLRL
jgi:hypothetical protein